MIICMEKNCFYQVRPMQKQPILLVDCESETYVRNGMLYKVSCNTRYKASFAKLVANGNWF